MSERFELPSELNIYNALEIRDALLTWVAGQASQGHDTLEVSARDVQEVDGSGLQLIAALANMGQPWRLVEVSEVFADACRILGLLSWLDKRTMRAASGESAS